MTLSTRQQKKWLSMPQFGLRTIMLLIAVTATWTACYTGRKSIEQDLVAIEAMHALAPELHVRHRNEYACLQIDRADNIREYQCYLPPGHEYKLHLLWSKEFVFSDKALEPETSATIAAGNHQILLNSLPSKLSVTVDGEEVMDVPRKRDESNTMSTGVSDQFNSQWYPLDQPLMLIRLGETSNGKSQNDLGLGFALWIEATD